MPTPNKNFFAQNLLGQENWERRGVNEGRIAALETRLAAAEATLVLIQTGAWTAYTPTFTASTTNPTIGTGGQVQTGQWVRKGRDIEGWARIKFGTVGPAAGTGIYRVGLPVAAATVGVGQASIGGGHLFDSSASSRLLHDAFLDSATWVVFVVESSEIATHGVPWAWAAGDEIIVHFNYEAAT